MKAHGIRTSNSWKSQSSSSRLKLECKGGLSRYIYCLRHLVMSTNIVRYLAIASLHPSKHQEYPTNKAQRYLFGLAFPVLLGSYSTANCCLLMKLGASKKEMASQNCRRTVEVFKIEALIWVSFWRVFKFQLFSWRIGLNPRRQSMDIEMKDKIHIKLVHELHDTCF